MLRQHICPWCVCVLQSGEALSRLCSTHIDHCVLRGPNHWTRESTDHQPDKERITLSVWWMEKVDLRCDADSVRLLTFCSDYVLISFQCPVSSARSRWLTHHSQKHEVLVDYFSKMKVCKSKSRSGLDFERLECCHRVASSHMRLSRCWELVPEKSLASLSRIPFHPS